MTGSKDDKTSRSAQSGGERTTPYDRTPTGETTDFNLSEVALRDLRRRYDLLGELGRGGMGIVYKARDRETDEVVALKILKPEIAARPDLIERFKAELRLARKITHKNVCRAHELLRQGDTVAITMEYVEGESLRAILERFGGVPLRRGLEWTKQICSALAEAHAQGVVHRDLKPENILIARDSTVKVMDFGIARSVEAGGATTTGAILGTPAYMSPEQAEGKPVDARTDIYALGLILYEMFTGQRAFHADTPAALVAKHLTEPPPSPRSVEPDLPARLDRAILKCLEKDPKKRFQAVAEIDGALAEKETPAAVTAQPQLSPHLLASSRLDAVLLLLGALGLATFLFSAGYVIPETAIRVPLTREMFIEKAREELKRRGWEPTQRPLVSAYIYAEGYNYLAERVGYAAAKDGLSAVHRYNIDFSAYDDPTHSRVSFDLSGDVLWFELPLASLVPPGAGFLAPKRLSSPKMSYRKRSGLTPRNFG
jgi:serine/threonine protein kinase